MNAHLLATGTTGFLGKVWLSAVLTYLPDVRVTLLVRGGTERMARILDTSPCFRPVREAHEEDLSAWLSERLTIIDADLCKGDPINVPGDIDAVVHFAGLTDFAPDPKEAVAVNVDGAVRVAGLCPEVPLLHVSTCYVAGSVGDATVDEALTDTSPNGTRFDVDAELDAARSVIDAHRRAKRMAIVGQRASALGWPNLYTWSKAMAERKVRQVRPDAILVRPAIVECAQRFPFPGWNEGVNTSAPLAWLLSTPFRDFPAKADHAFDVVPVDDVANGILAITAAALRGEADDCYQLASSDRNCLTFDRAVELTGLAVRRRARTHGENVWTQYLDAIPNPARTWRSPKTLSRWAGRAADLLATGPIPGLLGPGGAKARTLLAGSSRQLRKVDKMLELFRPFIHDNHYVFRADRVRELEPVHDELTWSVEAIDWRDYWVNVQYPGLCTWSIPLITGGSVPEDLPSHPPLTLRSAALPSAQAAK